MSQPPSSSVPPARWPGRRSRATALAFTTAALAAGCLGDGVARPRPPALERPYPGELIAHSFASIRGHAVDASGLYLLATGDPYGPDRPLLIAAPRRAAPLDARVYAWAPLDGPPGGPASDGSAAVWLGPEVFLAGAIDGHAIVFDRARVLEVGPDGAIVRAIESPDGPVEGAAAIGATPATPAAVLWQVGATLRWQRGAATGAHAFPAAIAAITPAGRHVYVAAGLELWRLDADHLDRPPERRLDGAQVGALIGSGGYGALVATAGLLYWQVGGAVLRIDDRADPATVTAAAAASWSVQAFAVDGTALLVQIARDGELWRIPSAGGEALRLEPPWATTARLVGSSGERAWFAVTRTHTPHLGPAAGATVTLTDLIAVPLEAL